MNKPMAFIIEDDEKLTEIFSESLKMAGFETEFVHDGALALDRLAEITPDLILLDLHLRSVCADDILRDIRADARLANVDVFLATADQLRAEMLRDDVTLVLLKPISVMQLQKLALRITLPSNSQS